MPQAFGPLLKTWRGERRISQMDLGLTANVSAKHISFLETGRAKPSKSMVMQLCESLAVPRGARNDLLNAAGFSRAYKARDLAEQDMTHVRAAMQWMLKNHDPFPAIAFDKHWTLLATNQCAAMLLGAQNIAIGDSLLAAFAEASAFRNAIRNWPEVARHMVVRLRTESAHHGGDDILDRGADRIAASLDSADIDSTEPLPAVIPAIYVTEGRELSFFSTIAQFGSAEDIALADIRIELMFPADDATRDALIAAST